MCLFYSNNGIVGTTALVVMASATEVMVSNCGDSRAVLCRERKAIDLSRDHKPFQVDEKARIEGHGYVFIPLSLSLSLSSFVWFGINRCLQGVG